jgi:hypothetical protein
MASAGMLAVTNGFENKTAEAMAQISPNIVTAPPTIEGVADGLRHAAAGAEDAERRARGADVRWARDWNAAFPDELLDRLLAALD